MAHLEYVSLAADDPNFSGASAEGDAAHYRVVIKKTDTELAAKLAELKANIESRERSPWVFAGLAAISFGRHAYEPLLSFRGTRMEISPVPLNHGERMFIDDLKTFYSSSQWNSNGRELYLIRNKSRGSGVGFYDEGGFYPDFILWLVADDHQHVIFVDPKGLQRVGPSDPKILFFETIKEIERRLGDPSVSLHSYIVSVTPYSAVKKLWTVGDARPSKEELADRHVLFQEEDRDTYIRDILETDK
jgi:hypothetical protein